MSDNKNLQDIISPPTAPRRYSWLQCKVFAHFPKQYHSAVYFTDRPAVPEECIKSEMSALLKIFYTTALHCVSYSPLEP